MSSQEEAHKEELAQISKRNWSWSVYPLVLLAESLSVGNLRGIRTTTFCARCLFSYGLVSLLINIFSQVLVIDFVFKQFYNISSTYVGDEENSFAAAVNTFVDFMNFSFHSIGTHVALIFVLRPRWNSLMLAYENLESIFDVDSFTKIRKVASLSSVYVVFVVNLSD